MTEMGLIIDCGSDGTWTETIRPLTNEELAARDAALAHAAEAHDVVEAAAADHEAARQDLATVAAAGQPVDAALLARLMRVDVPPTDSAGPRSAES